MQRNAPYDGPGKLSGSMHLHVGGGHYELTVRDCFDAAHALPGYDGPCQYLHGHTWEVEVTIAGQHLDDVGMLYDFKEDVYKRQDVSFAHYDGGADGVAAIVVQQAHCENDDLVYSVGIAEDGRLVGFRIS